MREEPTQPTDSLISANSTIEGPVRLGRWTSAEGSSATASAAGSCSIIGATLMDAHGPAAELALQVSSGFDPLVDLSMNIGLDPGPNEYPLLP